MRRLLVSAFGCRFIDIVSMATKFAVNDSVECPARIEVKPYGDSQQYRVAEVYRGIEIQVVPC
jgi:hypothetical protein